jgi:hypothetical protein
MALKSLEVLKKGLKVLKNRVKVRKETLQAQLAARKSISSRDESWLEDASDYERGFENLDEAQKGAVRKLREAAGDLGKVVGKKSVGLCWRREMLRKKGPLMPVVGMTMSRMTHHLSPAQHVVRCFRQHPSSTGMLNRLTIPLHASWKQFWPLSDVKYVWRNPGQCPHPSH